MRLYLLWELLLLSALTACSSQHENLAQELKTVSSWTATAQFVGESWLQKTVPTAYATETLEATESELHQEMEKIAAAASSQSQTQSLEQLRQIESIVNRMVNAIKQEDTGAMAQMTHDLASRQQAIHKLIDAGKQP